MAVGDSGTILSSSDNGASWSSQNSGSAAALIDVDIINPVIVAGSGGEVLLSTDQPSSASSSSSVSAFFEEEPAEVIDVPFGYEWIFALLALVLAAHRLPRGEY